MKQALASDATTLEIHDLLYLISKINVKDIITQNPISVPWDFTVEEAADGLYMVDYRENKRGTYASNVDQIG